MLMLRKNRLDVAIMATPLNTDGYKEIPVFLEKFFVFVAKTNNTMAHNQYILPAEIDVERLWLMEEGHCLRMQVENLCSLQERQAAHKKIDYRAGSLESLLNIVEVVMGITVIPELAIINFNEERRKQVIEFAPPAPCREISMVTYDTFNKGKLLHSLRHELEGIGEKYTSVAIKKRQNDQQGNALTVSPFLILK